jgi:hypothetical protein
MVETMSQIKEKYHGLLAADPEEAGRSLSFLYDGISDKIVYKGKPIPIILEPGFISSEQLQSNTSMLGEIQNALEHVIDIAVERYVPKSEETQLCDDIKQVFNLNEKELALMTTDCGVSQHVVIYRLDLYSNGQPYILEFNSDSAGGIMEAYSATALFLSLPQLKKLQAEGFAFFPDEGPDRILRALLKSNYYRKGKIDKPTILITDWRDVGSKVEQERLREHFEERGYKAILADPRDLTFRNGLLYRADEVIDIVYRRAIVKELAKNFPDIKPLFEATQSGAVAVVNSFSSAIGSNKAILAIMSDPDYHSLFNADTIGTIQRYVPWTRMLNFKPNASLLDNLCQNKDAYVLKQCKSYGGEAVIVGRDKDHDTWNRKIEEIIQSTEELWIVQKFVERQFDLFPFIEGDKVVFHKMVYNVNPFIIEGEYACGIVRLSPPDIFVINAAQGGAQIPMIRYAKRTSNN